MKYFVTLPSGRELVVDIAEDASGKQLVSVDGIPVDADAVSYGGSGSGRPGRTRIGRGATSIRIDGRAIELWLENEPPNVGVIADGRRFFAKVESERMRIRAAAKPSLGADGTVRSPMPGRVLRVLVNEGDEVAEGVPVIVVEAMKMENELAATRSGKVTKILVAAGATVEAGTNLVEISAG